MHSEVWGLKTISRAQLPPGAKVYNPVVTFTYRHNLDGRFSGQKARITYPGHLLQLGRHYVPNYLAVTAGDRDSVRFLLSIAVNTDTAFQRIDLKKSFLHEDYTELTPIFMEALPDFYDPPQDTKGGIWGA